MKNDSSVQNIGIKCVKLLISLHFVLSEISPYFVRSMSKPGPHFLSEITVQTFKVRNLSYLRYDKKYTALQ